MIQPQTLLLLFLINQLSLMNESQMGLTYLQNQLQQLEKKLSQLLDEQMKEKNEHEELLLKLRRIEGEYGSQNDETRIDIVEHHQTNLQYLDKRIENHENTLEKYKNFYENLHEQKITTKRSYPNNFYSLNQESNHPNRLIQSKLTKNDLESSVRSFKSTLSKQKTDRDRKKQMNVVCEMQCQNCGGTFKPYRYYSHINHCHKKDLLNKTQLSQSMLINGQ